MKDRLLPVPFAVFVFILPFPGTVSLRLLCLAAAFVLVLFYRRSWLTPAIPCKSALLVWALVAAAGVLYSFDAGYSLGEFKNEVLYALMAYGAFFAFARGEKELGVLLAALAVAATIIALWGAASTLRQGVWPEGGGHGGSGAVSAFFAAVVPLFAISLFAPTDRRLRWAIVAALALSAVGSIASGQRILWPLFVIQAATGAMLLRRCGRLAWSRRAGLAAGAGTIAVAAILFVGVQQWREQSETARPVADDVRLSVWPKAAVRIIEHPLIGAGLGRQAMRKAYPELVPDEDTQVWHAHNVFLNAGISMGLPGIAALAFVFGAFFTAYLRFAGEAQRPLVQLIGIAGVLMLLGILGRNLTNDFFVRDGALLFWALNGALLGAGTRLRSPGAVSGVAGR